jgi:hypothetical protein
MSWVSPPSRVIPTTLLTVVVIAIPTRLLWNLRIQPRQKYIIGITLCLSIFTIITCLVQIGGLTITATGETVGGSSGQSFDTVWQIFWQQIEACVAVTMISITSSPSVFTAHVQGGTPRRRIFKYWYGSRGGRSSDQEKCASSEDDGNSNQDPPLLHPPQTRTPTPNQQAYFLQPELSHQQPWSELLPESSLRQLEEGEHVTQAPLHLGKESNTSQPPLW